VAAVVRPPAPEVAPTVAVEPAPDKGQLLFDEAKALLKSRQYPDAKTRLVKCISLEPGNFQCHKLLGTVWAKMGEGEKGAREYRVFLKLAPPDHPDIDKVKKLLESFESQ
jgi:serine/threonine-protein kinase